MVLTTRLPPLLLALMLLAACGSEASAQSYDRAELLYEHGLTKDAKRELVDVVLAPRASADDKARAYYLLGAIAFEANRVDLALTTWRTLLELHPASAPAELVRDRIDTLASFIGESSRESLNNAIAESYLRHGDFWSGNKPRAYTIDSSWIPKVDAALKWYDKTIAEFPGSVAARVAHVEKVRTLLGWEDPGRHGPKHGLLADFDRTMPKLIEAFTALEAAFPAAAELQPLRYQIAQAFWRERQWDETRQWLQRVVTAAGDADSFYKDLAQRRLRKVEF